MAGILNMAKHTVSPGIVWDSDKGWLMFCADKLQPISYLEISGEEVLPPRDRESDQGES